MRHKAPHLNQVTTNTGQKVLGKSEPGNFTESYSATGAFGHLVSCWQKIIPVKNKLFKECY